MAELITFKCTKCQHVLKIGTEKAGRKAKCPKCGQGVTIPGANATPENPAQKKDEDEEDGSAYGLADEPVHTAPKVDLTTKPVLMISGDGDRMIPAENSARLAAVAHA